jgi:hypothetical protein
MQICRILANLFLEMAMYFPKKKREFSTEYSLTFKKQFLKMARIRPPKR